MLQTRVIPCLLLKNESLVKTIKFKKYSYIGDPVNTVRIFNEIEVDELMFLDIFASKEDRDINFKILQDIANECFMPLSYGGNIKSFDDAKRIFENAFENLDLIEKISSHFGVQSVIGSVDVGKDFFGQKHIYSHHGTKRQKYDILEWVKRLQSAGVGEIIVTSIEKDGTWSGYDIQTLKEVVENTNVPIIANGGCGKIEDIRDAVKLAGVSACAVGSMVVYQKKGMGVLINFPNERIMEEIIK